MLLLSASARNTVPRSSCMRTDTPLIERDVLALNTFL